MFRWGILGAAKIARKNWKSIRRSGNGVVAAVASRDANRAAQYIAECQKLEAFETPPVIYDDYDKLLASPDIDGVYIPLPTGLRRDVVIRAAEAGKHILCEKPCAPNAADLRAMIDACRRNNVQFMDGVMFMHHPRLDQLRTVLDDGTTLGKIRRINSHFSFLGAPEFYATNIRMKPELEPLGCLGDLGWYSIRFTLWALKWELPRQVTGVILQEQGGVPSAFSGDMVFASGATANFYCSFLEQHQQWANVSGEKGFLRVPDFVLPLYGNTTAFETWQIASRMIGCDYLNEPTIRAVPNLETGWNPQTAQEANMVRNFANQSQSGKLDESWPDMALRTQIVANACLDSARAGGRLVEVKGV